MFTNAESQLGISIDMYSIGPDQQYADSDANFLSSYGINNSGAILVRPDGFIAWRAQTATTYTAETGGQLITHLLDG